jgi:hypothetical protein
MMKLLLNLCLLVLALAAATPAQPTRLKYSTNVVEQTTEPHLPIREDGDTLTLTLEATGEPVVFPVSGLTSPTETLPLLAVRQGQGFSFAPVPQSVAEYFRRNGGRVRIVQRVEITVLAPAEGQ